MTTRISNRDAKEFKDKRMEEQEVRNVREGNQEPKEPLGQYKTTQLRHYLRTRRCVLKGRKQDLINRLRKVMAEMQRFPNMPNCSQIHCYTRGELQTYLRERGAEVKGSKKRNGGKAAFPLRDRAM